MRTLPVRNGDWDFGSGLLEDLASVRERVRERLLFLAGEWYSDSRLGTPYESQVLGRSYNPSITRQALDAAVISVDGVTGISDVSMEVDAGRVLRYRARIGTPYGNGEVEING